MGTEFFTAPGMLFLSDAQPFSMTALAMGMLLTFRAQNCHTAGQKAILGGGAAGPRPAPQGDAPVAAGCPPGGTTEPPSSL